MINLINLIISFFMNFEPIGLILPLGILKFFKKDNSQSLPEAYQGVRDGNKNKDEYIKQKVDQVDQSSVIETTVDQVTRRAEDQWNYDNPHFREIQNLIIDSDYCGLVGVYRRDGLNYPKAFWNSFNVFIKDHGDLNKGVYSIDKTIGEFIHDLIETHGFYRYNSEIASMIDACKELRDDHGILFNTTQLPPADNTETTAVENEGDNVDEIIDIEYSIDDDEDDDIISMDSDDEDDDDPMDYPREDKDTDEDIPAVSSVDNTAPFYRKPLDSEDQTKVYKMGEKPLESEESTLIKAFDKYVSPTPTIIMKDDIEIISPVIEIDVNIGSSSTKKKKDDSTKELEKSSFNPNDKSTWNDKHKENAKWCLAGLPTCSTCGGDREGNQPTTI